MKLLFSGFDPFDGENVNPSQLVLPILERNLSDSDCQVRSLVLPVSFRSSFAEMEKVVRDWHPDVVISMGQAGGRSKVCFERVALNLVNAEIPDNDGAQPAEGPIVPGAPLALPSTLPLAQMQAAAQACGVASALSSTAGLYVCNYLMYRMLFTWRFSVRRAGFIHLPYLPEQISGKPAGTASMSLDDQARALTVAIEAAL